VQFFLRTLFFHNRRNPMNTDTVKSSFDAALTENNPMQEEQSPEEQTTSASANVSDADFIPSEFMSINNDAEHNKKNHPTSGKFGTLFLVASHIGNPEDMSQRALKALKMADIVVGEEGKTVARLLHDNRITKKLEELNEHNESQQTGALLTLLQQGKTLALVSDAGTPLFADPGAQLVRRCIEKGIPVKAVPGASSIMTALVTSGLPMDSFVFAGFVSREPAERIQELKRLADEARTVVLLETPYRLVPLLEAARQIMPSRRAYLGCNLTMEAETHHYGTISELYTKFVVMRFKGEFVFCFEGNKAGGRASLGFADNRIESRSEHRTDRRFERGEKKFGDKKFGERKFSDKPRGERPQGERKFSDKPRGERPQGERKFSDKPRGERPQGERKFSDKPRGERPQGERKFSDKPRGERSFGDKKFEGRGEKRFGDKPRGDRPFGDKKFGDKKFGDKKFGNKQFGDKKFGDKKFNDRRSPDGTKSRNDGDKPTPNSDKE
jgi:16S rRNA (cytidine(1402)-2'-O)-methyltransferase